MNKTTAQESGLNCKYQTIPKGNRNMLQEQILAIVRAFIICRYFSPGDKARNVALVGENIMSNEFSK